MKTTALVSLLSVLNVSDRIRVCLEDQTGRKFDPNQFMLGGLRFVETDGASRVVSHKRFKQAIETAFMADGSRLDLLPGAKDGLRLLKSQFDEVRMISPCLLAPWVGMDDSIMLGAVIHHGLGDVIRITDCDSDPNCSELIELMNLADCVVEASSSNLMRIAANDNRRTFLMRPEHGAPGWRVATSSRPCPNGVVPVSSWEDLGNRLIAA